jgi:glycosyltransferase involved in cell wall biosynthesis
MLSSAQPATRSTPVPRPRLLFLSPRYLFPADSGGKIRTVSVLRGLLGGAFEIHLVSPMPESASAVDPAQLGQICDHFTGWNAPTRSVAFQWTRMRHLVSGLPVAVATDYSRAGRRTVDEALSRKPDLIVVDFPHAAVLAPGPYPCPSVLFTHNVEAEIFRRHAETARDPLRRAVWRSQATKMARYERGLLGRFDAVVAVAERDREYFVRAYGANNVSVIPTGVDLDYFSYSATPVLEPADPATVVFTGSMDWMANIDGIEYFMDQVWPEVARVRPEAKFVVVGRQPPAALVERAASRGLNWEFTGFVDDVRPYVRRAHVYVIPLRVGGGTRIKVYEAMALGCPVVSTRIGVEGLPVQDGRQFMAADRPADMAASILALLERNDERSQLSAAARRFVEETVSTASAAKVFEQICQHALRRAHTR